MGAASSQGAVRGTTGRSECDCSPERDGRHDGNLDLAGHLADRGCRVGLVPVLGRRGRRYARRDALSRRDPEVDYHEIYRQLATLEFPWDIYQALSFALFRTYAVASIGELLDRSGEFTARAQKRYDDTVLILDAVLEHGFDHPTGSSACK